MTATRTIPRLESRAPARRVSARPWLIRHDGVLAILVYLLISLIWYRSVVAHMSANCACGLSRDPGDGADYVWWFQWFVQSLGHGLPLMHPSMLWTPTGLNMYGTTASLLLAAVVAPITLLWGPIPAYNVVMILAPVLSGWAANRLCRHLSGAPWPSLLAGAIFGFSTYEIAHLIGHPQLVLFICPPLVALTVVRLLDGTTSRNRFVVELSVLLIAQIFISIEVLFTMTIVGVLALGAYWLTGTSRQRRELVGNLPVLALPYLIAAVASSWYLVPVLRAPTYATGAAYLYPTDALSFLVPLPYTWLGGSWLARVTSGFAGNWTEDNAYLGLPLLLILGNYLITRRRTQTAQLIGILAILLTFWTLGPILWVGGRAIMEFPYHVVADMPLLDQTIAGRMAVYLELLAAVALAIWLTLPRRRAVAAWICALIALICVLPNLARPSDNNLARWTNPSFFRTAMYTRYLKPGETVLPIKWGPNGESFMWQAEDHMYWNMANGYWMFTPPAGWKDRIGRSLWENHPRRGDGPRLREMIIRRRVSDVVVQDGSVARWGPTIRRAGLRVTADVGGVTIYHVPASWLTRTRS